MTPSMRRQLAIAAGVLLALAIPLAAFAATRGGAANAAPPSFTRDVAPVIQQKCAGCHRVGGIAPFPLETSRQIASRSALIAAAVQAGLMPPWPPGPRSPAYAGEQERRLSDRERATLLAWANAGGRADGPAPQAPSAKPPPGRTRGGTPSAAHAVRVQAARAEGRHRRLPLLPPRPEASRRLVRHLRTDRAGQPQGRPPRHPLPRRQGAGSGGEGSRLPLSGARVELLRRDRTSSRLRLRRDPGLAERCELGRRLGAGLGRQSPPRRHGCALFLPGARS